jgi:hypothetical protein
LYAFLIRNHFMCNAFHIYSDLLGKDRFVLNSLIESNKLCCVSCEIGICLAQSNRHPGCSLLHRPHKMFFSTNLYANKVCSDMHAKFCFGIFFDILKLCFYTFFIILCSSPLMSQNTTSPVKHILGR